MNIPSELKYTKEHEWIKIDGDIATVGITEFAQSELGDIVYVDVDTVDDTVERDEVFGSVEAVPALLAKPLRPQRADAAELEMNPRSRSAVLRIAQRLGAAV